MVTAKAKIYQTQVYLFFSTESFDILEWGSDERLWTINVLLVGDGHNNSVCKDKV